MFINEMAKYVMMAMDSVIMVNVQYWIDNVQYYGVKIQKHQNLFVINNLMHKVQYVVIVVWIQMDNI